MPLSDVVEQCRIFEQTRNQSNIMQNKEIAQAEGKNAYINCIESTKKRKLGEDTKNTECFRCGNNHNSKGIRSCPTMSNKCHQCGRIGHYARKCRTGKDRLFATASNFLPRYRPQNTRRFNYVDDSEGGNSSSTTITRNVQCFEVGNKIYAVWDLRDDIITVTIGGIPIKTIGKDCRVTVQLFWTSNRV